MSFQREVELSPAVQLLLAVVGSVVAVLVALHTRTAYTFLAAAVFVTCTAVLARRYRSERPVSGSQETSRNRPFGVWFGAVFVVAGAGVVVNGLVTGRLGIALFGVPFVAAGAVVVVTKLRAYRQAVPGHVTAGMLVSHGWDDWTERVRQDPDAQVPGPVLEHLKLHRYQDFAVAELAGVHPSGLHAAAMRTDATFGPVMVAESWVVTGTSAVNDRVVGGTVEPRVVAWCYLPADVGSVTIRPDSSRMKLADLAGVRTDFTVDWSAVDDVWHLHGDDEPLLRAVVDIGLMGRLSQLPGEWVVRIVGRTLMVIPTAPGDQLTAKPLTLADVAGDIGGVVVSLRSILPQLLWDDLDGFLAGYRT